MGYLPATVIHGTLVGARVLGVELLLLFEEFLQDVLTFSHGSIAEVRAEHLPHVLHLGVHHFAVGLDHIRGQHQQREHEAIALPLKLLLATVVPLTITVAIGILEGVRPVVTVGKTDHCVIEKRSQGIASQCPQGTKGYKPEESSYPFS